MECCIADPLIEYICEYMKSYIRNKIKCIGEIKCYNPGIIFQKTELDGPFHCLNLLRILAMITDQKSCWFLLSLAAHISLLASHSQEGFWNLEKQQYISKPFSFL